MYQSCQAGTEEQQCKLRVGNEERSNEFSPLVRRKRTSCWTRSHRGSQTARGPLLYSSVDGQERSPGRTKFEVIGKCDQRSVDAMAIMYFARVSSI
jgi:hypothetical protein